MDISRIVRRILSERKVEFGTNDGSVTPLSVNKTKAKGQNEDISYEFLENVINNCKDIANGAFLNKATYTLPNDMLDKFPELKATGVQNVAFRSADVGGGDYYIAFGKKDPNAPKPALFAYRISSDRQPEHMKNGMAGRYSCEALTKIEDLGQVQLSPQNKIQLDAFVNEVGPANVSLTEPSNINLYEKISYQDLKNPTTNKPVFDPIPFEKGYIWVKKGIFQQLTSLPDGIERLLNTQGFTGKQPDDLTSDEARYGIYISDIINSFPALKTQGADAVRQKDIIYPASTGDTMNPDREACRTAIKKLYYCITSTKGQDCQKDLLKNKFIALRCGDLRYVGGIFGLKDEYEKVLKTGDPYGVGDLKFAIKRGAQYNSLKEMSLERKVNFILNEQRKKFRF